MGSCSSMLHYHNIFDQLRNLVTMPPAPGNDLSNDKGPTETKTTKNMTTSTPEPVAKPEEGRRAACSTTHGKSHILKAWEQSLSQGKQAVLGSLNGTSITNGTKESQNGHPNTAKPANGIIQGTTYTGEVFTKINPQAAVAIKPCTTLPPSSERTTTHHHSATTHHSRQRSRADVTTLLAPSGMSAPHNMPLPNRHPLRIVVPEKGSLFDIIRANPQSRLFVRPMAWVDDHSRHLNVTWLDQPRIDSSRLSVGVLALHYDAHNLHADVNSIFLPCTRNEAPISDALPKLFPRSSLLALRADPFAEMRLWFDSRVYRFTMRVECLWRWPFLPQDAAPDENASFMTETTLDAWSDAGDDDDDGEDPTRHRLAPAPNLRPPPHCGKPMLAYVGREWLRGLRNRHMRVPAGNGPVARLSLLQEKQLMPTDPVRDPRFVSILIAMAQEHAYPPCQAPARFLGTVPPRMTVAPAFHDVTVRLLVHDLDGDFLVYRAVVSADYLRRFHDPLKAFAGHGGAVPGLEVEVTRVAESPRVGLRERLADALGEEIVGPVLRDIEARMERSVTPDVEDFRARPERDGVENGAGGEERAAPGSEGKVSADHANGAADQAGSGKAGPSTDQCTLKPEPDAPGSPFRSASILNGAMSAKRARDSGVPCPNGTVDEELALRDGKKRRLSGEKRLDSHMPN